MADLSGLSTNFFATPKEGFTTTLASTISSGAVTVPLNSITGYTNGAIITLVVDPTDPTKKQAFTGVVDTAGVQVTSVKWTEGTNQSHTTGSTVVDYVTATHMAALVKGLLIHLNQDGTLKNNAITSAAQITDGIIGDAEMATAVKPVTLFNENTYDHVVSGLVITADSAGVNRNYSVTSGVVMLAGKRCTVAAVSAQTVTASKDRYIDVRDNGDGTASHITNEVNNNAASQALTAGDMRIGIVVAGATFITNAGSINQGEQGKLLPIASSQPYEVTDSLGNLICPRDPNRRVLGMRTLTSNFNSSGTGHTAITGLSVPFIPPNLRKVKASMQGSNLVSGSANQPNISIWDGTVGSGTQIAGAFGLNVNGAGVNVNAVGFGVGAGTLKTYNGGIQQPTSGTATIGAASTTPVVLLIEQE